MLWQISDNQYSLQSGTKEVLCLRVHRLGQKGDFSFDGKDYKIWKQGFWSPSVIITERNDGEVLRMKTKLFSTSAKIELSSGNSYLWSVRNDVLAKMSFSSHDEVELLNYHLKAKGWKAEVVMNMLNNDAPAREMLMHIVLGAFAFKDIIAENTNTSLIMTAAAG